MILPPGQSPHVTSSQTLPFDASALFRNLYVVKRRHANIVMVTFNGAVKPPHPIPLFKRWSWAVDLPCHMIVCSDTLADAHQLNTGWYVGTHDQDFLAETIKNLRQAVRAIPGRPKVLLFGSSAGGFAALMTAMRGFGDHAIAINPQIDLLRYNKKHRDAFLALHGPVTHPSRLSILQRLPNYTGHCSIEIRQCLDDLHHLKNHFTPFIEAVQNHPMRSRIHLKTFEGEGHTPPGKSTCIKWIQSALKKLAAPTPSPPKRPAVFI